MRGKFFCKNRSKKMQNCERTERNLQVRTKGNQIKNFSRKRLKTPNWWKLRAGTSLGEDSGQGTNESGQKKLRKKQNLRAKKAKNGIFSNFGRGHRQPVRTGSGPHCAHRKSASRDALCSTQRVRPSEKLKKNQNKTNPKLTHPETRSQSQNQKNKPIFSKQSSHKRKTLLINGIFPQWSRQFVTRNQSRVRTQLTFLEV